MLQKFSMSRRIITVASKRQQQILCSIWVATAARYVPDFIYNIGTTVLNGGVSMVIFFFVNKVIFPTSD